jgi:AraC family transcriptional regulator
MTPIIETLLEKKLAGKRITMSLADNKTGELWKSFMPRRSAISNNLSSDVISMQVYPAGYFEGFSPTRAFEKWAAVEVPDFENIPEDMETFILKGGLYAVFHYTGSSSDNSIFQYIFTTWLPGSAYVLDDRPHFEVLGAKYKNNDPTSEEEIWIPVKPSPGDR